MKKTIFLLLISAFHFTILSAQQFQSVSNSNRVLNNINISGKITDAKTGEPLPGATIAIADIKLGTIADQFGKYQFNNIPAGHHLVEITHTGYTSVIEHIDLNKTIEKDFALQPSIVENQAVVITGVSGATNARKAPVSITSVKKTELLQSPSAKTVLQ